jgi:hypothetical protein
MARVRGMHLKLIQTSNLKKSYRRTMNISCKMCDKKLKSLGGILFSPPMDIVESVQSNTDTVKKHHVCNDCWFILEDWIINRKFSPQKPIGAHGAELKNE